ncbi:MAG: SpoIID/LytB domain-containing protein [Peptoniphilus sp.]|nr:SpoIID/LytB domain-containing protein [Peptoniphilus sp.]
MKKLFLLVLLFAAVIFPRESFAEDNYFKVKIGKALNNGESVSVTSESSIYIVDSNLNKILDLDTKKLTVSYSEGKIVLKDGDRQFSADFSSKGNLFLASDKILKLKNAYRGYITFIENKDKVDVINYIELEDYLKGVVPKEISPSSHEEALKSQAIVARSFAMANKNKYIKQGYNLNDTTACQVYGGQSAEKEKSTKAVTDTAGIVAMYDGKVANTIYGASSGGFISDASEVWGGKPIAYMTAKEDPHSPLYEWEFKTSKSSLDSLLKKSEYLSGSLVSIEISEYDSSGRAKSIEIVGTEGVKTITGSKFRALLGNTKVKSTLFEIQFMEDSYVLKGSGYGHGVGLSQMGAMEMAKKGFTYEEILSFYFPNITVEKINERNI